MGSAVDAAAAPAGEEGCGGRRIELSLAHGKRFTRVRARVVHERGTVTTRRSR
jgi:hypothetical protein